MMKLCLLVVWIHAIPNKQDYRQKYRTCCSFPAIRYRCMDSHAMSCSEKRNPSFVDSVIFLKMQYAVAWMVIMGLSPIAGNALPSLANKFLLPSFAIPRSRNHIGVYSQSQPSN